MDKSLKGGAAVETPICYSQSISADIVVTKVAFWRSNDIIESNIAH